MADTPVGESGLKTPPNQEAANIEAYARTFQKCVNVAKRLVGDEKGTPLEIMNVAEVLFKQFYHDQVELAKSKHLVKFVQDMLQRTRGY